MERAQDRKTHLLITRHLHFDRPFIRGHIRFFLQCFNTNASLIPFNFQRGSVVDINFKYGRKIILKRLKVFKIRIEYIY